MRHFEDASEKDEIVDKKQLVIFTNICETDPIRRKAYLMPTGID